MYGGDTNMARAVIVYSSVKGATKSIGELIADGISSAGHEATVISVRDIKTEADLGGYLAYVFGSPTYHGEMLETMKTMLFLAEKVKLEGKIGGSFGAFGWSGEATGRIYDTMKNIFNMDMVSEPLRLKSSSIQDGPKIARDYGAAIAKKMG
jgi:flavorubredoxin